jgi:hypothetical protein
LTDIDIWLNNIPDAYKESITCGNGASVTIDATISVPNPDDIVRFNLVTSNITEESLFNIFFSKSSQEPIASTYDPGVWNIIDPATGVIQEALEYSMIENDVPGVTFLGGYNSDKTLYFEKYVLITDSNTYERNYPPNTPLITGEYGHRLLAETLIALGIPGFTIMYETGSLYEDREDDYIQFIPTFFGLEAVYSSWKTSIISGHFIAYGNGIRYMSGNFIKKPDEVKKVDKLLPFSVIQEIARTHLSNPVSDQVTINEVSLRHYYERDNQSGIISARPVWFFSVEQQTIEFDYDDQDEEIPLNTPFFVIDAESGLVREVSF